MGALTIAFDTVIAGALALPWVLLFIELFYSSGGRRAAVLLRWLRVKVPNALAGVLLFTIAYFLGSVVSRVAQDFFNDDDLYIHIGSHVLGDGVTEDRIRTSVYCKYHNERNDLLIPAEKPNPYLAAEMGHFSSVADHLCGSPLRWSLNQDWYEKLGKVDDTVEDIFSIQESALLLRGEDPTLRLRQLHDQIMVLRGAAFNGLIAMSLCIFAWTTQSLREKRGSWSHRALALSPLLYLFVAVLAASHHFADRAFTDPPYMEFTLFLLGLAGAWLVWKRPAWYLIATLALAAVFVYLDHWSCLQARSAGRHVYCVEPAPFLIWEFGLLLAAGIGAWMIQKTQPQPPAQKESRWNSRQWAGIVLLSFLLTLTASLGWWSTEVLYAEQVIYSYDSQPPPQSQP